MKTILTNVLEYTKDNILFVLTVVLLGLGVLAFAVESLKKKESTPSVVTSCPSGQTLCSGQCIDVTTNLYNCGACGFDCSSDMFPSGSICLQSMCDCPVLTPNTCTNRANPMLNICVNNLTDSNYCGTSCTPCNLGETCQNGVCVS
jgi:hypothetical protein